MRGKKGPEDSENLDTIDDLEEEVRVPLHSGAWPAFSVEGLDLPQAEVDLRVGRMINVFEKFGLQESVNLEEGPLREVLDFCDRYICRFDLENSCFFDSEPLMRDFVESFMKFRRYLERELETLKERALRIFEYQDFEEGWENRVRKAGYHAFLVHYGEKRKAEVDEDGRPRDYVYHTVRTGFNCLIRKMQFFDEEALIAALLHDTRENCDRGLFAMLKAEKEDDLQDPRNCVKGWKPELVNFLGEMEEEIALRSWDLSGIIEIVTKIDDLDRAENFMLFLWKLAEGFSGEERRFETSLKAMMVKFADRLDNIKTFMSGKTEMDLKSERIKDETVKVFMYWAEKFGMVNVFDWFLDYLYFRRGDDRRNWNLLSNKIEEDVQIRAQFREEFDKRMKEKLWGAQIGENYWLEFRPIGYRYLDMEETDLDNVDVEAYSKHFRNYIIFTPIGDHSKNESEISFVAAKVFREIFNCKLDEKRSGFDGKTVKDALGRVMLLNHSDKMGGRGFDMRENGYGAGVWSVFRDQKTVAKYMLGAPILAYHYKDKLCTALVKDMFVTVKDDLRRVVDLSHKRSDDELEIGGVEETLSKVLDYCFHHLFPHRHLSGVEKSRIFLDFAEEDDINAVQKRVEGRLKKIR